MKNLLPFFLIFCSFFEAACFVNEIQTGSSLNNSASDPTPASSSFDLPFSEGDHSYVLENNQKLTTTLWFPVLEWSKTCSSCSGNPFEIDAQVLFTHEGTGTKKQVGFFYNDQQEWKFRFSPDRMGLWKFETQSSYNELNGLKGEITVVSNPNPKQYGFVTSEGSFFARPISSLEDKKAFVPQLVMYSEPNHFYQKPEQVDQDIATFIQSHGFSGFHVPVYCRWFELNTKECSKISSPLPDFKTFEALEMLITKVYQAGGIVHLWMWGDNQNDRTPEAYWGLNEEEDQRLQRYIAARLGPIPGWTMGYGFDLNEWASEENIMKTWHSYLHSQMPWSHLLGGRSGGPNNYYSGVDFPQYYEGLDYSGYEQHKPTYDAYVAALQARPGKPVLSEDRFRIRLGSETKDYTMEMVRVGLWESMMAGGVANIWGNLINSDGSERDSEIGSSPFPKPEYIQTYSRFASENFSKDLIRDSRFGSWRCLRNSGQTKFLFFGQNMQSIQISLSSISTPLKARAVDTKRAFTEIDLGTWQGSINKSLPYSSDWAISLSQK